MSHTEGPLPMNKYQVAFAKKVLKNKNIKGTLLETIIKKQLKQGKEQ